MEFSSHTFKPHQKPLFLCMFVCSNTIDAYVQYFSILRRLNGTPKNKTKRRCDQECSGMLLVHRRLLFTYCLWQRSDQNETKMRRNSDVRPTFHRWDIFFATRGQCKLIHRASQADHLHLSARESFMTTLLCPFLTLDVTTGFAVCGKLQG